MSTITLRYPNVRQYERESEIGRILILISLVLIAMSILVIVVSTNTDSLPSTPSIAPVPIPVPTPPIAEIHSIPSETPAPLSIAASAPYIVAIPVPTP